MPLQANIDDGKIDNFSNEAKITLVKQMEKYGEDIINESNLIEQAIREAGASEEITSNIVLQAVRKNRTKRNQKSSKFLLITKIISSLSLLVVGFLFDSSGYQDKAIKFILFVIILIIACVSTVLQFVLEDKE